MTPSAARAAISSSWYPSSRKHLRGVLAEERRRTPVLRALVVDGQGKRREPKARDRGMRQRLEHPEGLGLLGGRDIGHVRDQGRRHAGRGQARMPVGGIPFPKARREQRHELLAVSHSVRVRPEARVVHELGQVERGTELRVDPVVPSRDHQLAVARSEHLVGGDHREDRALPRRHRSVREVPEEVVADVRERRLVERRVDDRALAGALALEQRRHDAERRPHPGSHVDQRRPDADAAPSLLAGHADEAARGLHERVVPRLAGERPDPSVGADGAVDDLRVPFTDGFRTQPQPLRKAWPQALEEHVCAVGEPQHHIASPFVPERDRQ